MNAQPLQRRARGARRQRGFSMIELSIALLIALFLIGGLLTIEQGTRKTFGNQNLMAQLQDNERLAMTMITDVIQAAGYYPDPTQQTALSSMTANGIFTQPGQPIVGTYNGAAPGDTVTVRYMTALNDGVINCIGGTNNLSPNQYYTNQFSVSGGPFSQLQCALGIGAAPTMPAPTPLVSGVTNLEIWYGVNTAGGSNNVDSYLRANLMSAANWLNVTSVMVRLTFNNPLWGQPGQPQFIYFTRVVGVMNRTGV